MRAGKLDRRWTLQRRDIRKDGFGADTEVWSTQGIVWGSFEPLKGRELWAAQQSVERAVARVRIRYNRNVTADYRIKNAELGQFEILGEPEHYRHKGETVLNVSRLVE